MLGSTLIFVMAVIVLAGIVVMAHAASAKKLGYGSSRSGSRSQQAVEPQPRIRGVYDPARCYNDCVRVHERTDPNFPCAIACGVRETYHF